jgi:hypothetical protein
MKYLIQDARGMVRRSIPETDKTQPRKLKLEEEKAETPA